MQHTIVLSAHTPQACKRVTLLPTMSLEKSGFLSRPTVHINTANKDPTANCTATEALEAVVLVVAVVGQQQLITTDHTWTVVQVMGYGKTFKTCLLYLHRHHVCVSIESARRTLCRHQELKCSFASHMLKKVLNPYQPANSAPSTSGFSFLGAAAGTAGA